MAGSVIQLVPTEVMVKQPKGRNETPHDWEFFELNVSKKGTSIPILLTQSMLKAVQNTHPRCPGSDKVSAQDAAALKQLDELRRPKAPAVTKSS